MNTKTTDTKAPTMEAFFTRKSANHGIEIPLFTPDGSPTDFKLTIVSVDSDRYYVAEPASRRRQIEALSTLGGDMKKAAEISVEERFRILSALVVSWNFPQECTEENVYAFLKEAPQIAEQIDRLASRRSLFFKASSTASTPSQETSSS